MVLFILKYECSANWAVAWSAKSWLGGKSELPPPTATQLRADKKIEGNTLPIQNLKIFAWRGANRDALSERRRDSLGNSTMATWVLNPAEAGSHEHLLSANVLVKRQNPYWVQEQTFRQSPDLPKWKSSSLMILGATPGLDKWLPPLPRLTRLGRQNSAYRFAEPKNLPDSRGDF